MSNSNDAAFLSWSVPDGLPPGSEALYVWQDGRCALCGKKGRLVEDHCHESGNIRGLLCRSCNVGEGAGWSAPKFVAWRNGTTAAAALGVVEQYVNAFGITPRRSRISDDAYEADMDRVAAAMNQAARDALRDPS